MPRAVQVTSRPDVKAKPRLLDLCVVVPDKAMPGELQPDDVLVHMTCRPISPADVICLQGKCKEFHPPDFPATPGLEGCGKVDDVGADVKSVKKGDRVLPLISDRGHKGNGTWQEFVVVKEAELVKIPDEIPDEAAAQAFLNPCAVMGVMDTLAVPEGESLLCVGAESTYDKETIAYAHKKGVKVMCIAMDDTVKRELKGYGADVLINVGKEDVQVRVEQETGGKGAYAAVCPKGGTMPNLVAVGVRDGGTILIPQDFTDANPNDYQMDRGVKVQEFSLAKWLNANYPSAQDKGKLEKQVLEMFKEGTFQPVIGKKFDFNDFELALKLVEDMGLRGGVPLVVS